ncbi:Dpy-30 motif-domain-containing protein [Polychytrium aggregatum]|uniref:Dpy-30 motif-domain-containing protein n=1 Tax=Polychytrium aggregatum TaxID=110093 RepID=UPI0022FDCD0D|nr:Dpy-30 motif-domain-containing protein [Polychytrium aggregatum]KAI9205740.1 Dpy-30 motif-domain-containing protein [Polychytrium aggregatum]
MAESKYETVRVSGNTDENPFEAIGLTNAVEDLVQAERHHVTSMNKAQLHSLPLRSYLDQTLIPVLSEGMKAIAKERPPNPCEYLALFLLRNGPK